MCNSYATFAVLRTKTADFSIRFKEDVALIRFECLFLDFRLLFAHSVGHVIQMHAGCDGVECGFPFGELHALLLPAL